MIIRTRIKIPSTFKTEQELHQKEMLRVRNAAAQDTSVAQRPTTTTLHRQPQPPRQLYIAASSGHVCAHVFWGPVIGFFLFNSMVELAEVGLTVLDPEM